MKINIYTTLNSSKKNSLSKKINLWFEKLFGENLNFENNST